MANVFDQFDAQANVFNQFDALPEAPIEQPGMLEQAGDVATAGVTGANILVPAIAGLPMDTATALANLVKAGYGGARMKLAELGVTDETLSEAAAAVPEPAGPQVLGSEWFKEKIAGITGDVFTPPDPSDPLQQKAHLAGSVLGAGTLSPAAGAKQLATNIARMGAPAAGAVTGQTLFPEEPLAPMAGMMLAPGAVTAIKALKPKVITPEKAFIKAHKLGYKVPPVLAKPTKTQQALEGTAGPVPTKQAASIKNQKVTNRLIKQDIGYPKETPLSKEGLDAIRLEAGKVYKEATKLGNFRVDKKFNTEIGQIAQKGSAIAKEFPGMVKKDIVKLVDSFKGKESISSEALVEVVKQLRADSSAGFRSSDPATLALAKANGKMANALEGLMERNIQTVKPGFLDKFKSARQRIAKTYTIENAMKGENVDAVALGRLLDSKKGKALSGTIKDVAEFGQNFKGAAQVSVPQQTNFRPADVGLPAVTAITTGNPMYLILMGARPALRTTLLSKPYQSMLARVKPKAIKKIMKLPEGQQAKAAAVLLEEFKGLGNETQTNSQ